MNDLTLIFKKGIESQKEYNHFYIIKKIRDLKNIFCDTDDDGAHWDLVWENIDGNSVIYAFFSQFYPVALVKENCPKDVISIFNNNSIHIAKFEEPFSCEEKILQKYIRYKHILDDRFLDNGDFPLDDERLYCIYEDIDYITPYNFTFNEIR